MESVYTQPSDARATGVSVRNPGLEIKRIRRLDPSDSGESTHSMALTSLSRMGLEHADIPIAQKIGHKKFKYLDVNGKEISKAEAMDKAGGVAFYQDAAAPTKGRLRLNGSFVSADDARTVVSGSRASNSGDVANLRDLEGFDVLERVNEVDEETAHGNVNEVNEDTTHSEK